MRALSFLCFLAQVVSPYQQVFGVQSQVEKGIIDLSSVSFEDDEVITLKGEWVFYQGQLLTPNDFIEKPLADISYLKVPGIWNNNDIPPQGVGTYRLHIKLPANKSALALYIPNTYSAYKLYVDDKIVAKNGKVATVSNEAKAEWNIKLVFLEEKKESIDLIWQISNYHHYRGGAHKAVLIGSYDSILNYNYSQIMGDMLLVGGLLILGASALAFFMFRTALHQYLYFGLLSFFWAIRSIFSHIYVINHLLPDIAWETCIKFEYASFYLTFLFTILFIHRIFGGPSGFTTPVLVILNFLFVVSVIVLEPLHFTVLLNVFFVFVVINLLYIFYLIIMAILAKRFEGWFSLMGVLIALSVFVFEFLSYNFSFSLNYVLLNTAYLSIFFVNSLVLVYDFAKAHKKNDQLELEKSVLFGRTRI
jgi:hypothetical protein